MNKTQKTILTFLSETANDYYIVWDSDSSKDRYVKHEPPSSHKNFLVLLNRWYPELKENNEEIFAQRENHGKELHIYRDHDGWAWIIIEAIDNDIHNTAYITIEEGELD